MPAGVDLIFFDNSSDWELAVETSRVARQLGEDSYAPIEAFRLGVSLNTDYIAVIATSTRAKDTWVFAGDITQVYNFPKGSRTSNLGSIQPTRTRLFLNRLQLVETNRVSTDNFDLKYAPPYWFRTCAIRVYKYVGDKLNFVEDSLFDIGNALGIDPNNTTGTIIEGLLALKLDIENQFIDLNERLDDSGGADEETQQALLERVTQLDRGIFTLAQGLADLLPEDRGNEIRQQTQTRLNLDMGFL